LEFPIPKRLGRELVGSSLMEKKLKDDFREKKNLLVFETSYSESAKYFIVFDKNKDNMNLA
jgi:hypothetical protein